MELRPYQVDAIGELRSVFEKASRVILTLPTGAGKTVVFTELVNQALQKDLFARALILTDRVELLGQAGGTLGKSGIPWSPIKPKMEPDLRTRCHVAMVETFARRAERYADLMQTYDIIIIDEAHRGNFKKLFQYFPEKCLVVGATATPVASDRKDPLKNYYGSIVCPIQIPELVEQGYLVPAVTYSAKIDRSMLRVKMGEYTDESMMDMFDKREVYDGVVNKYRQFANGRKAICFNVNIQHSQRMVTNFRHAGITAEHVDGTTPALIREQILADFKAGNFQVLCNVGIVTTGYDEPSVSCIIVNRVTKSTPLWLQMCGRGSRIHAASGKKNFVLLDMGENYKELGMWEDYRDWKKEFYHPKKAGEGIAPTKTCPGCSAIVRAAETECPQCGFDFIGSKEVEEQREVEFELIKPKVVEKPSKIPIPPKVLWPTLSIHELAAIIKSGTSNSLWVSYVIRDRTSSRSEFYAELRMYQMLMHPKVKPGFVWHQSKRFADPNDKDFASHWTDVGQVGHIQDTFQDTSVQYWN
jgi:superfamily II DNA or RNA helicase